MGWGASQVPPAGCSGHQAQFATSLCRQPPGQPCHPAIHTCGSPPKAGDMHIQTLGFPCRKEAGRQGRHDGSFALAQARDSSQGGWRRHLDSHEAGGGSIQPFPWGGRKGTATWAFGTHCFLSDTEELGHVPDDVAEVVIHFDVGAHPGGQLGSGVCTGEPSREGHSAREPACPHPLPGRGPMQVGGRTCGHRGGQPHSRGDAG